MYVVKFADRFCVYVAPRNGGAIVFERDYKGDSLESFKAALDDALEARDAANGIDS